MLFALFEIHDREQLFRVLLAAGTLVVSFMLLVLMVTRWGQARLLYKCVALSLFTHLLLVGYAQIYTIVIEPAHGTLTSVRVGFMDDKAPEGTATPTTPVAAAAPWEKTPTASDAVRPEDRGLARPEEKVGLPENFAPNAAPVVRREINVDTLPPDDSSPVTRPVSSQDRTAVRTSSASAVVLNDAPKPRRQDAPQTGVPSSGDVVRPIVPGAEIASLPRASTAEASEKRDFGARVQQLSDVPTGSDAPEVAIGAKDFLSAASNKARGIRERDDPRNPAEQRPAPGGATSIAGDLPRRAGDGAPIPQVYGNRERGKRAGVAEKYGGTGEAEAAVVRALDWLARAQESDGRFSAAANGGGVDREVGGQKRTGTGADADAAVTALASLAFLAGGTTHLEGDRRETVQHALEYLLRVQGRDGNLYGPATTTYSKMYCHGMATLAVSEAYAVTGDQRLKAAVQRAVNYTIAAQSPTSGGWRYQPGDEGDMSQFGWQVMALRSAELAGIEVPTSSKLGMQKFLRSVSKGGLASYRAGEKASRTMTAEALACRIFLDVDRTDATTQEATKFILEELPGTGDNNEYYWYYATLGLHQLQNESWKEWNRALQKRLIAAQVKQGSDAGSWSTDSVWGGYGGRVYTTAMNTMSLEVYYRYLPLYGAKPGK